MNTRLLMKSLSLLIVFALSAGHALAAQVGEIKYARGAVTVQNEDGSRARLTGKGAAINEGEVLKTGPKSFAIIRLDDDTRMTLRPGTSFAVEEFSAQKNNKASALLRLFRGGLRTVTGFISKFNPDAYKIKTSVATIGIRGTEFDARICEQDCAEENKKLAEKNNADAIRAVAKVVFLRGKLQAENFRDELRNLKSLSPIFEGDTILTGEDSYAVLVFRDKSRVSLQELTNFRVDELRYSDEAAKKGSSALFSLLRGGLRTVTGLIGKLRPKSYSMRTSIATIGIRGTGYDLLCTGPCAFDGSTSNLDLPNGDGAYGNVWKGVGINMGGLNIDNGQAGFIQDGNSAPIKLPEVPDFFKNNPVPTPDTIKVDESTLFADAPAQKVEAGVYVSVKDGKVTLKGEGTNDFIQITKGQAAFAGIQGRVAQLPAIPLFQAQDIFPTPDNFSPKSVIFGSDIGSKDGSGVCEVK